MTDESPDRNLRPYQAEAVTAIAAGLRDGGRRQLRAACGTGKTYIASTAAAELLADSGGVVVVLVPSIALAAQTITAWQPGCPVDRVLAVCSDYTASRIDCEIVGVNISREQVRQGRELIAQAGLAARVDIRHGNVLHMALPDGGVDAAICLEVAGDICMHAADKPRLLAELRRVLRPGGQWP